VSGSKSADITWNQNNKNNMWNQNNKSNSFRNGAPWSQKFPAHNEGTMDLESMNTTVGKIMPSWQNNAIGTRSNKSEQYQPPNRFKVHLVLI